MEDTAANVAAQQAAAEEGVNKNPMIECVSKKARALRKKLNKIYTTEEEQRKGKTLNQDQLDSIKRKPQLEAALKEFEEIMKAMEVVEQENAKAEKKAAKRRKAEEQRLLQEQADKFQEHIRNLFETLYIVSLQTSPLSAELFSTLMLTEQDVVMLSHLYGALFPAFDAARGSAEHAADVVAHLSKLAIKSEEPFGETTYAAAAALLQRIQLSRSFNPNAPLPEEEFVLVTHEEVADAPVEPEPEPEPPVPEVPEPTFSFMHESELETEGAAAADAAESPAETTDAAADAAPADGAVSPAETAGASHAEVANGTADAGKPAQQRNRRGGANSRGGRGRGNSDEHAGERRPRGEGAPRGRGGAHAGENRQPREQRPPREGGAAGSPRGGHRGPRPARGGHAQQPVAAQ